MRKTLVCVIWICSGCSLVYSTGDLTSRDAGDGSAGDARMDSGPADSGTVDSGMADSGTGDSGMVDSGMVDSGMVDAGCVDGMACDTGNACEVGEWRCTGGTATCVSTGPRAAGTSCSGSGTCDGSGRCRLITGLALGAGHTCAMYASGDVKCWGLNTNGQIGDGTTASPVMSPTAVMGLSGAQAIAAGDAHTCAVDSMNHVLCWGYNFAGQLGDGTTTRRTMPVDTGLTDMTSVFAFAVNTCATCASCSVGSTPGISCWGDNTSHQVHSDTGNQLVPRGRFAGSDEAAVGNQHICSKSTDGTVACVGANNHGQLGNDSTTDSATSVPVPTLSGVAQVVAGEEFTCARRTGGTVYCWGNSGSGRIGSSTEQHVPTAVTRVTDATSIAAGQYHACALHMDGTVSCWGYNAYGQLGDGNTVNVSSPQPVLGITDAVLIAAGNSHTCAVLRSGGVMCWGRNNHGQLGDGTLTDRNTPVAVVGL